MTAPAFAMVPLAALGDRRLGLRDLRVLGVLYGYANTDGVCWPSRAAIAEATGLPVTRVSEVTARLVRLGWLRKSHEGRTVYRVSRTAEVTESVTVTDSVTGYRKSDCKITDSEMLGVTDSVTQEYTSEQTSNRPTTRAQRARVDLEPPDWISRERWAEFLEHRRAIKAPMTDVAQKRALAVLAQYRMQGHDPNAVLEQSIVNGWRGLFPLKGGQGGGRGGEQARIQGTVAALQTLFGEQHGQADVRRSDDLPGGGLRDGDIDGETGGVLGPARRAAR